MGKALRYQVVWCMVAGALISGAAPARQVTQMLAVSGSVAPSARVEFEVTAQPITITSNDLKRGYVEVEMKSRIQMHTARVTEAYPAMVLAMNSEQSHSIAMSAPAGNANGHGKGHDASAARFSSPLLVESGTEPNGSRTAQYRYRFELTRIASNPLGAAINVSVDL